MSKSIDDQKLEVRNCLIQLGFTPSGYDNIKEAYLYQRKVLDTNHTTNVWEFDETTGKQRFYSYQVQMVFETAGNIWASIEYYSLGSEELIDNIEELAMSLYDCVPLMLGNPSDYRMRDDNDPNS